jgi:uncharacterized protein (DUF779 family)
MPAPRIVTSGKAKAALETIRQQHGTQVIVLRSACSAPSIARVRSRAAFLPQEHQVVIGSVARCPVYVDSREINSCPHETIMLDLAAAPAYGTDDTNLITRPESVAEREERIFSDHSRQTRDATPPFRNIP